MGSNVNRWFFWFFVSLFALVLILSINLRTARASRSGISSNEPRGDVSSLNQRGQTGIERRVKAESGLSSETAIIEQFQDDLEAHGVEFALESLKKRDFVEYSARIASAGIAEVLMNSGEIAFFDALGLVAEIFGEDEFGFLTVHLSAQLLRNHSFDQDPAAVRDFLADLSDRAIFQLSAQDAGNGLVKGKDNPLEVVKIIEQIPNLEDNSLLLKGALKAFLAEDIEGFTEYLTQAGRWTNAHDEAVYAIYTNYTVEDPAAVMSWVHMIRDEELRDKATYGAAINLARDSPEAFQEWIKELPDGSLKSEILDSL